MPPLTVTYDDALPRRFVWAAIAWAGIGMLIGLWLAVELVFPDASLGPWSSFGRLRPVHTTEMLYAFAGNATFAGIYYSSQRLLETRLPSKLLGALHFGGWQIAITLGILLPPLGFSQGRELSALRQPLDLFLLAVWLVFALHFFWLLKRRHQQRLYISLWFTIAYIIAVAVVFAVDATRGLLDLGGASDAFLESWSNQYSLMCFLVLPTLGLLYYLAPKSTGQPLYSYRLAILHFWSFLFLLAWAAPPSFVNTALPEWAQSLSMLFGLLLLAPSLAGAWNGFMTLTGDSERLRRDPIVKFFAAAIGCYALASLEASLLSIKSVNGFAHFTDWGIGHTHLLALGWSGLMAAGSFYWLVPRLYQTNLHSVRAANLHLTLATLGLLLYVISMWIAGATQGSMWRAENYEGGLLYPNFLDTVLAVRVMHAIRIAGGLLYVVGFILMEWNLRRTARAGRAVDEARALSERPAANRTAWYQLMIAAPVIAAGLVVCGFVLAGFGNPVASFSAAAAALLLALVFALCAWLSPAPLAWHRALEARASSFCLLIGVVVVGGAVFQLAPQLAAGQEPPGAGALTPYTTLELGGRDVYIAEGCHHCHSQTVRPFLWETARYPGGVSMPAQSRRDRPALWGSRRIGPDLARVGGKYPHSWHYDHLLDPRAVSPGSTMPSYRHLALQTIALDAGARADAQVIVAALKDELGDKAPPALSPDSKLVALIAYLQRLGR